MYVTTGNLRSLMTWFEKGYNPTKFLCLLVAGHLRDAEFFKSVFDSQEAIDVISGQDIAIFLFANKQTTSLSLEVRGGEAHVIPGELLLKTTGPGLWYHHISEINKKKVRDDVIRASQNVSHQITSFFHLGTDDIPCILLMSKGNPQPWIIRTKGEADVQTFFDFLKGLRILAESLPTTYDLDWPRKMVKYLLTEEELTPAEKAVEAAEADLKVCLDSCIEVLEEFGMSRTVAEALLTTDTALRVWEIIGLRKDVAQPVSATHYTRIFTKAIEEGSLKERCREVIRTARKLERAKGRLLKHKEAVEDLREWGEGRKEKLEKNTTRQAIDDLCEKYKRKFTWKSRTRPLKEFAELFMGITSKTKELLSLQEAIKKVLA